jgi:hypothetical protein
MKLTLLATNSTLTDHVRLTGLQAQRLPACMSGVEGR